MSGVTTLLIIALPQIVFSLLFIYQLYQEASDKIKALPHRLRTSLTPALATLYAHTKSKRTRRLCVVYRQGPQAERHAMTQPWLSQELVAEPVVD